MLAEKTIAEAERALLLQIAKVLQRSFSCGFDIRRFNCFDEALALQRRISDLEIAAGEGNG